MTHLQISESFCERVNRLREELLELSRGAQLILDDTGAYLVTEGYAIDLGGPTGDEVVQQENDMLLPYVLDTITAPEEVHDLTEAVFDHDIAGLLSVATDPDNPNGQRVNAYRRLGEYISTFQEIPTDPDNPNGQRVNAYRRLGEYISTFQEIRTATSIKHELQGYSHQNGSRTYQIAQRLRSLAQAVGMLRPKNLQLVTPDWIYKLPKQEYERLLKMCGKMHLQLMSDLWGMSVGSQELPLEGGNLKTKGLMWSRNFNAGTETKPYYNDKYEKHTLGQNTIRALEDGNEEIDVINTDWKPETHYTELRKLELFQWNLWLKQRIYLFYNLLASY
ncbi:hypothetical protein Glove_256g153 [Diversispora epigaea]|uniref:Uncharacterized protein n=1 Tax=Diversispora epigaea TaxID=1348612 RepID=A0A397I7A6_9GLOM|nr:hypothetical protein Glove_256g153 [Diversispora epigaea]